MMMVIRIRIGDWRGIQDLYAWLLRGLFFLIFIFIFIFVFSAAAAAADDDAMERLWIIIIIISTLTPDDEINANNDERPTDQAKIVYKK